jgi:hypothetical protein
MVDMTAQPSAQRSLPMIERRMADYAIANPPQGAGLF